MSQLGDIGSKIFHYIAKIVNGIGAWIVKSEESLKNLLPKDLYIRKYKPTSLIVTIATNIASSRLVNFSVLERYKEEDFANLLEVLFTLIHITPEEEVTSYIKVIFKTSLTVIENEITI